MGDILDLQEELPAVRSLNSDEVSEVKFVSRTQRAVDVFWVNYRGERVRYTTLFHGESWFTTTYVLHPWVFRDAESGDKLQANKQDIFYPPPRMALGLNDEAPDHAIVYIDIPVYSLKEWCLQKMRQLISQKELRRLPTSLLPWNLKYDLLNQENIPYHNLDSNYDG